jgi:Family of unknown function (DUF5677)
MLARRVGEGSGVLGVSRITRTLLEAVERSISPRMFFKTGQSPTEVGFLSPEMEPMVAQCRKQNAIWFALAEDINRTAQATLTKYQIGPEISAQHLFGFLLLIRTLSNFQGGLLMAERGMVVEARTLFRCCFENVFWLGALLKDGDQFISDIMGDEVASTKSKARWVMQDPSRLEFSGPNAVARLQARVDEMEKAWGKVSGQKLEDAAKRGRLGDAYIYYKVLSGDAAHPSVSAMDRYVQRDRNSITGMTCGPFLAEVSGSLNCGCQAMIAAGVAITEMLGDTEHNKEFAELARAYGSLNGIS